MGTHSNHKPFKMKIMEEKVRNIIVAEDDGQLTLIYCLTLTHDEIRAWCEIFNIHPTDIYEVTQEDLQYYSLSGRVWCDTPGKEAMIRKLMA